MGEKTRGEVFAAVKEVVREQLQPKTEITEEADFVTDLGADSLDVVELVMAVEDRFGKEIPDDDAGRLRTVGQLVDYLHEGRLPESGNPTSPFLQADRPELLGGL